jgi:hypothetical protein
MSFETVMPNAVARHEIYSITLKQDRSDPVFDLAERFCSLCAGAEPEKVLTVLY